MFQIGDRVKVVFYPQGEDYAEIINRVGTVISIEYAPYIRVLLDNVKNTVTCDSACLFREVELNLERVD